MHIPQALENAINIIVFCFKEKNASYISFMLMKDKS